MKKLIALALISASFISSNASAYTVPERDYGAFDELIRALTFWKPKVKALPNPKKSLVELPEKQKSEVRSQKTVKKLKSIEEKAITAKEVKSKKSESISTEDLVVKGQKAENSEKVKKIKSVEVVKEVPAVESLEQVKVELIAKPKKKKLSLAASAIKKPVKAQKVSFQPTKVKSVPKKKKTVQHDRFQDFSVPERIVQKVFDPKHSEISGTVTGQILRQLNHRVQNPDLKAQGIRELIGVGTSNFTGSDKARLHNIHNAITKFDGRIIKQGEEFSFNDILKNAGPSNGFVLSKVIINGMTKYGWGGGVCQLSTTLFRSVFNSGLPITARRNHTFQVPYYTPQGFDATIYLGGQDFKFVNTTPGDVMIQIVTRGDDLAVLLYGTRDRKTHVSGPFQNGMKYTWKRTVIQDGEAEEDVLASYYQREIKPVAVAE